MRLPVVLKQAAMSRVPMKRPRNCSNGGLAANAFIVMLMVKDHHVHNLPHCCVD
ncbi:MAG TPA: hypothetical protein VKP52_07520 [Pseudolabrys sp.]|nr:hypothetical protein [Pseudolabrys sp.]